jgi:sugar/nucleoside kinase (ribokinase family)
MSSDLVTIGCVCADVKAQPIDTLPERGTLALIPSLDMAMGGLAGVTAAVYSRLGGRAAFAGCLGNDAFGDFLIRTFETANVDTTGIRRIDGVGSAATVVLIDSEGERTFLHNVGTVGIMSEDDIDFDLVGRAKVFHWGGPGLTPKLHGDPIARVFEKVQAMGVKTSIDTCFDGSGTWLPLMEAALPHTDILCTSMSEAPHYAGTDNPDDIARFFLDCGIASVLLKMGSDGLMVCNETDKFVFGPHQVNVVDGTGAGDAACAGFLHGLIEGWDLERCGALANAVGGLTVQTAGTAGDNISLEAALSLAGEQPCLQT